MMMMTRKTGIDDLEMTGMMRMLMFEVRRGLEGEEKTRIKLS